MRSLLPISLLLLFATPALADFEREVKPLLVKHCVSCHGPKLARVSLRLDRATAVHTGSSAVPVIPVPNTTVLAQ
jgi:hypothetical protein